jgi:hypothetical protein
MKKTALSMLLLLVLAAAKAAPDNSAAYGQNEPFFTN